MPRLATLKLLGLGLISGCTRLSDDMGRAEAALDELLVGYGLADRWSIEAKIEQTGFHAGQLTMVVVEEGSQERLFPEQATLRFVEAGVETDAELIALDAFGQAAATWPGRDAQLLRACASDPAAEGNDPAQELCTELELRVPDRSRRISWTPEFTSLSALRIVGAELETLTETWDAASTEDWSLQVVPFQGSAGLDFGGVVAEQPVVQGAAAFHTDRAQLLALASSHQLGVTFLADGVAIAHDHATIDFSWLVVAGEPEHIDWDVDATVTRCTVRNPTIDPMSLTVTSGYKDGARWLHGGILGTPYFGSTDVTLAPGEVREVEVHYPQPITNERLGRVPEVVLR